MSLEMNVMYSNVVLPKLLFCLAVFCIWNHSRCRCSLNHKWKKNASRSGSVLMLSWWFPLFSGLSQWHSITCYLHQQSGTHSAFECCFDVNCSWGLTENLHPDLRLRNWSMAVGRNANASCRLVVPRGASCLLTAASPSVAFSSELIRGF